MKSLRSQLMIRLLLGGALLIGSAGVALDWKVRRLLTAELDSTLGVAAQSLAAMVEQEEGKASLQYTKEDLPQFQRPDGADVYLLLAEDGSELERSISLGKETLPVRAGRQALPEYFNASLADGRKLRCAGLRFVPHEEMEEGKKKKKHVAQRTEVMLIVGRDRAPLDRTLAALRAGMSLVLAGALGALAIVVRWSVAGAMAPLDNLGRQVAGVNATSLGTRVSANALPAELRPIADRLNELLARLQDSFARERRFTATASHELRTPLAELRSLAEVNLSTPATESERVESWQDILTTTRRMESLSFSLLKLARAEDPAHAVQPETVLVLEAVSAAWRPWASRAAERGIALEIALPPDLTVETDPQLLGVIFTNLCGNAAEHSPAGTALKVGAAKTSEEVTLLFCNPAGDLSEEDLLHIFERFWRKDQSRADARHHGLGLSLAAEFATLLGGTLTARLRPDGDLEMALRVRHDAPSQNSQPRIRRHDSAVANTVEATRGGDPT